MSEQQRLTRLISDVYDAALGAAPWADALAGVAAFVGGQVGGILTKDNMNRGVAAHCQAGVDPHYMRLFHDTYSKIGPVAMSMFCDVDRVVGIPELMPYEEFCRGCFYREWAQPQGWVDVAISVLEKSANGCVYLSIARDKASGMVDDEVRRRMAVVTPHVRRATLIGRTLDAKTSEAAALADVLDGLNAGLMLLDAQSRIVHANTAGQEVLNLNDFLRSAGGRLIVADIQADKAVRKTVAAAGAGDADAAINCLAFPLSASNGDRYVVHLLPLTFGARRDAGASYPAVAAMFVRKAALPSLSPPEVIAKTYKLTPTELRVLFGIVEIGGVPEVAAALGVADTTIKTHLSRLFEKTGTGRQADLVKLVAGFATPLAN
jgi:DNA-binding CsgD family transcriptional regulator